MSWLRKMFGGANEAGAGGSGGEPLREPELTFARAAEEMRLKTEAAMGMWGLGQGGDWGADLETGIITFNTAKGYRVTAPLQIVGTLDTTDGSWLWGWDHPSAPPPIDAHAQLARDFGERHGLARFTTRQIAASEEDAWTFTAVACHLAGAQGGYRGPAGSTLVFMTYGTVTIAQGG